MAFLELSSISKSFGAGPGARHVLDEVNLAVEQ